MSYAPALLEQWMRDYYFRADIDIGSSGLAPLSMTDVMAKSGLRVENLQDVLFADSETYGGSELRAAIASRYADGDRSSVMATHGSSEAIFLVTSALLSPTQDVVVLHPTYTQLRTVADNLGCRVLEWSLHSKRGYRPDFDALRSMITARTGAVIVNFPHNPTGSDLAADEWSELISVTADAGIYLIVDEAFSELVYGSDRPFTPPRHDRIIRLGTLSKSFGLPGLRVGWCIAPKDVLERCALVRDHLTLHLSPLIELIATCVIRAADRFLDSSRPLVEQNLETLSNWISEHGRAISWRPPRGGVCAFPRIEHVEDTRSICRQLAEDHRILLVPGHCFGEAQHVRLGFGCETDELKQGLKALSLLLPDS